MGEVTEKTKANAREQAWRIHGACLGLAATLDANGLDASPAEKAARALQKLAEDVQERKDKAAQAKAEYHAAVQPPMAESPELEALRREVSELRAQLGR